MDLKVGQPYFFVGFYDPEFAIPSISTLIYLGIDSLKVDDDSYSIKHFFQDADSYAKYGNLAEKKIPNSDAEFIYLTPDQLDNVMDKTELIEWLKSEHSPYFRKTPP